MLVFSVLHSGNAWYVLRNGAPTARNTDFMRALAMALLLTRKSCDNGEDAEFAGIIEEGCSHKPCARASA